MLPCSEQHRRIIPQSQSNHSSIPQDIDKEDTSCDEWQPQQLAPVASPRRRSALSTFLVTLPLRPSTLTALLRSGFSTTGDVMNSCQTDISLSTEAGSDAVIGIGSNNSKCNNDNDGKANNANPNDDGTTFGHFAKELGCSPMRATDYVREIDESLVLVGLPKISAPTSNNDNDGDNNCSTVEHETSNDNNNIMAPPRSILPATAASLLRAKANNHFPDSNNGLTYNARVRHIVSFSQAVDMLLGGGLALSELTEIVGLPGVGKTQLAMQLAVDTLLPEKNGGVEGYTVVIDAEGSWCGAAGGDRLWAMANALADHVNSRVMRKLATSRAKEGAEGREFAEEQAEKLNSITPESILQGIHIFRVHDEASQTCTLYNLPKFLLELEQKGTPVKLVVIDSVAFHYRVASAAPSSRNGNGNKKNNSLSSTHNLTRMAAFLSELASEFDLAVLAINHLTTRIDKDEGTKLVPALGESWAHSITSRIMIDHHRPSQVGTTRMDEVRACTLVKSPHKPVGTAYFVVTDKGVRGVPPDFLQPQQSAKRARVT
ncbi:hypothetical protein ACHAWU_007933 [Discostella pseudostelligera]|uniref:DNA repair protein RAD51 homolog 3 n=1 Tax=Discostella pseudostelligera TaxID=259834 RepID=A0ABD3M7T8_9STRA